MSVLFCLHVDLVASRAVTEPMDPDDRRRFALCCLKTLELLSNRVIDEQGGSIWWAGDGGILVVEKTREPNAQLKRLLEIAEVFPGYVSQLAQPPVMNGRVPRWPLHFRRGISIVDDVPSIAKLDLRAIGSLQLANALKNERGWVSPSSDYRSEYITVWQGVEKFLGDSHWKVVQQQSTKLEVPKEIVYLQRSSMATATGLAEIIIPRIRTLENCTLYALQAARKSKADVGTVLRSVFEPKKYIGETLFVIHEFVCSILDIPPKSTRIALFIPVGKNLVLRGSAATTTKHRSGDIPIAGSSAAGKCFREKSCVVIPDANSPPPGTEFTFLNENQKRYLQSLICLPVQLSSFETLKGESFPELSTRRSEDVLAILAIDSNISNAFGPFFGRAEELVDALDAFVRDIEIGILLGDLQGWTK